ncbi:GNAT family N-acetyltransferase [Tritonibacter litoralis]|uniref:GNAT family N-acetyltransferase n=1 Tax=Tritonibacter litoralis TaxID=2662264 RepID=UPI0031B62636
MWLEPIELKRQTVTLVPLHKDHASDLAAAVADGDLHKLWYTNVPEPEGVPAEINRRLTLLAKGSMVPFAVVDGSGTTVGMTTFVNIDAAHQRVESGST